MPLWSVTDPFLVCKSSLLDITGGQGAILASLNASTVCFFKLAEPLLSAQEQV